MNNLMWSKQYIFILSIIGSVQLNAMKLSKNVNSDKEYIKLATHIQIEREFCIKNLKNQEKELGKAQQLLEKIENIDKDKRKLIHFKDLFLGENYALLEENMNENRNQCENMLLMNCEKNIISQELLFYKTALVIDKYTKNEKELDLFEQKKNQLHKNDEQRGQKRKLNDGIIPLKKKKNIVS